MKWVLHNSVNELHYWILKNNEPLAELKYNHKAHSLRLKSSDMRLFFLEQAGNLLITKILLLSEYNVTEGEASFNKKRTSGVLILNENKFSFEVKANELTLFTRYHKSVASGFIENVEGLDLFEFSALLFSFTRVHQQQYIKIPELSIAS